MVGVALAGREESPGRAARGFFLLPSPVLPTAHFLSAVVASALGKSHSFCTAVTSFM